MKSVTRQSKKSHKTLLSAADFKDRSWRYMYNLPPTGELTIEEFELYARDRLKCNNQFAISLIS